MCLILDVDKTLVHTVKKTFFECGLDVASYRNAAGERELFEWSPPQGEPCYIKLRPGVRAFVSELHQLYELCIYSMGDRAYVEFVMSLIDPDRAIFPPGFQRVACREDMRSADTKEIQRVSRHPLNRTIIFDDRHDVWAEEIQRGQGQVGFLRAYPYEFFLKNRRALERTLVAHCPGVDAIPGDFDEHLIAAARLFRHVHAECVVEAHVQPTARMALAKVWKKTLRGIRMFILDRRGEHRAPAEAFGAKVEADAYPGLHLAVVQADRGSNDPVVEQLHSFGVPCVNELWLSFCFATFALQDPRPFALGEWREGCRDFWDAHSRWQKRYGTPGSQGRRAGSTARMVLERLEQARRRRVVDAEGGPAQGCAAAGRRRGAGPPAAAEAAAAPPEEPPARRPPPQRSPAGGL